MASATVAVAPDVGTGFEPPESIFDHVLAPLRSADLRFAQVERIYTESNTYQEQAVVAHSRQHPRMATAFSSVPFDVVSIASNHTGDWGPDAVIQNADTFHKLGIATIGAGRNIDEARRPALFERNGVRIAFLGYASVLLPQYWATAERPGAAPVRAHTFYEPYEFQPGAPAHVVTVPHAEDLEHMGGDIRAARANADIVLVSLHWGVHFTPRPAGYQPVVAHAAIDAGAHAVLGHHPHQPQSVELYKDGVIFYSIGNFSFFIHGDKQRKSQHSHVAPGGEYTHQQIYSLEPDPGFSFDYRRHSNEGGIVYLDADRQGLRHVTYLPTLMDETGRARVVTPDQTQFAKSLEYLNWTGHFVANGATQIRADGDRYLIHRRGG